VERITFPALTVAIFRTGSQTHNKTRQKKRLRKYAKAWYNCRTIAWNVDSEV